MKAIKIINKEKSNKEIHFHPLPYSLPNTSNMSSPYKINSHDRRCNASSCTTESPSFNTISTHIQQTLPPRTIPHAKHIACTTTANSNSNSKLIGKPICSIDIVFVSYEFSSFLWLCASSFLFDRNKLCCFYLEKRKSFSRLKLLLLLCERDKVVFAFGK